MSMEPGLTAQPMKIYRILPVAAFLTVAVAAGELRADIVIFQDGRTLKVDSYNAREERMELTLSSGGRMEVALARIERVVDDEVVPEEVVEEVRRVGEFPQRSWGYSEQSAPRFSSKYNELIIAAAKKYDVDAGLISAVIQAESDFDAREVSHKGARGLMQLMPATAERFGVKNSFDPQANINGGTRYLRWLLDKFEGNADFAVAAYNAGEGNVWKYKGIPPFRETINYVKKIARSFNQPAKSRTVAASVTASASR
jgi:hypothetical protein